MKKALIIEEGIKMLIKVVLEHVKWEKKRNVRKCEVDESGGRKEEIRVERK